MTELKDEQKQTEVTVDPNTKVSDSANEVKASRPSASRHLHRANNKLNAKLEVFANKHGKPLGTVRNIFFGGVAVILVAIVVIILSLTVFSGYMVAGDVQALTLYPTRTVSQVINKDEEGHVEAATSFKYGEAILAKLDLKTTGTEDKNYTYEVFDLDKRDDSGNPTTVRKGSFPVTPAVSTTTNEDGSTSNVADDSASETVRYIALVTSSRSALEAGNYELVFTVANGDDTQTVGKIKFSVTGEAQATESTDTTTPAPTPAPAEENQSSDNSSSENTDNSSSESSDNSDNSSDNGSENSDSENQQ